MPVEQYHLTTAEMNCATIKPKRVRYTPKPSKYSGPIFVVNSIGTIHYLL